jgi:hypothetical protein
MGRRRTSIWSYAVARVFIAADTLGQCVEMGDQIAVRWRSSPKVRLKYLGADSRFIHV